MTQSESEARIERELGLAREVQRSMLPEAAPTIPGYSFSFYWEPAHGVGGDMYDFHALLTGQVILLVADVAGKGLGAAIGMAALAAAVPLVLEQTGADLTGFLAGVNRSVFRWASRTDRFVTLIAISLDPVAHHLRVANAGHDFGVIRRHDGTLDNLCPDHLVGLPLGVINHELPYNAALIDLGQGDAVVIASDGLTHAVNTTGDLYGTSRLNEVLTQTEPDAAKLGKAILADLNAFTSGLPLQDDQVLLCFARDSR